MCLHGHNLARKLGTLPRYSSKSCKFLTSNPSRTPVLFQAAFLSLALSLPSSQAPASAFLCYLCSAQGPHPSQSVPSLFISSALRNLSVSNWFGSSQAPCSPATSFGTTRRSLPATERSRNTFAHEQQHQSHCEALSSVSKVSLRHHVC